MLRRLLFLHDITTIPCHITQDINLYTNNNNNNNSN